MRRICDPIVALIAVLVVGTVLAPSSFAQGVDYPSRPIKLLVGASPGGTTDTLARVIAAEMTSALGRPVFVENRPGAGGNLAADAVAKAAPDGYTLLVSFTSHTINATLYLKLPYDPVVDFTPISMIATVPSLLVGHPKLPATDLVALVGLAKAKPDALSIAIGGIGSSLHLAGEQFKMMTGTRLLNVPYKGTGETIPALLGGQIDMIGASTVVGTPYVRGGQTRMLGISGETRAPTLPEVPTFAEQGYPDVKLTAFYGLWFPAGTPRERVERMYREVKTALATPEMARLIEQSGLRAVASTPDEFAAFLAEDIVFQAAVNRRIGISLR